MHRAVVSRAAVLRVVCLVCAASAARVYHEEYPYMVSIQRDAPLRLRGAPSRLCAGSLVTDSWVLTAAHCLVAQAARVRYGDFALPANQSTFSRILSMVSHPGYHVIGITHENSVHLVQAANDIGLMLVEKIKVRNYAVLSAVDYRSLYGLEVMHVGFGSVSDKIRRQKHGEEALQAIEGAVGPCAGGAAGAATLCASWKCGAAADAPARPAPGAAAGGGAGAGTGGGAGAGGGAAGGAGGGAGGGAAGGAGGGAGGGGPGRAGAGGAGQDPVGAALLQAGRVVAVCAAPARYTAVSPYLQWLHGVVNDTSQRAAGPPANHYWNII